MEHEDKEKLILAAEAHKSGRLDEAENIYREILIKNPDNPDALHLLGVIDFQQGKHDEAIDFIKKAINLKPNVALYYNNLGMIYDIINNEEESVKNFQIALKLNPNYPNAYLAYYNLGVYFNEIENFEMALEHYNRSIELNKNFYEAYWNRSLICLLLGDFEKGWKDYEYRFKKNNPSDARNFNKPQWDGSELKGKKILILSEQGFGDDIQFIRYLPFVKEKGGDIIFECKKELRRLIESSELGKLIDEFIEKNEDKAKIPEVEFDFYIHLMSLPRIFNASLNNVPNKIPYLETNIDLNYKIRGKINLSDKNSGNFKIGIVWSGNPKQDNDKNRSATFEDFKILKEIEEVRLFSLQKGRASEQLNKVNDLGIINLSEDISDFADTAGVIEELDLIISVDTSVAHLAGAMGKPVWLLLSHKSDWRWLLNRDYSPWYPSMKIFRQEKLGDWNYLIQEVREELKKMLEKEIL
ncbi:tetratricopeptide repeat protein [Candidatus Pacearchaeota archaeon]|nr:tetratricopeptide repeat protein [Candidatus Pacearchaeota archaeon]